MNDAPDNRAGFGFIVPTDRDRLAELGSIAGGSFRPRRIPTALLDAIA